MEKAREETKSILMRLMGSKLEKGDIAKVARGPMINNN